jgi:hypothetical protein
MSNPSRTSRMISRSLRIQRLVFRIGKPKYMLAAAEEVLPHQLPRRPDVLLHQPVHRPSAAFPK